MLVKYVQAAGACGRAGWLFIEALEMADAVAPAAPGCPVMVAGVDFCCAPVVAAVGFQIKYVLGFGEGGR